MIIFLPPQTWRFMVHTRIFFARFCCEESRKVVVATNQHLLLLLLPLSPPFDSFFAGCRTSRSTWPVSRRGCAPRRVSRERWRRPGRPTTASGRRSKPSTPATKSCPTLSRSCMRWRKRFVCAWGRAWGLLLCLWNGGESSFYFFLVLHQAQLMLPFGAAQQACPPPSFTTLPLP